MSKRDDSEKAQALTEPPSRRRLNGDPLADLPPEAWQSPEQLAAYDKAAEGFVLDRPIPQPSGDALKRAPDGHEASRYSKPQRLVGGPHRHHESIARQQALIDRALPIRDDEPPSAA